MSFSGNIRNLLTIFVLTYCQNLLEGKFNVQETSLDVKVQNGWITGRKIGDSVYGWNGIPYAKPPVGNLRFELPQEPDNWIGIWNATYDRSQCVSTDFNKLGTLVDPDGNEDCLYINVYAPKPPQTIDPLLPVMVWIHGGTFLWGNSSYTLYGPDQLVQSDVIVVSFNYRLGIFGFLSTNDNVAPGNIGLKDQIFALKWIKNNIQAFGGNPYEVTIFGESAGAASVSYLTLSSASKGLFKKAIMQSGTALCPWSLSTTAKEAAYKIAEILNINARNSKELVEKLKYIPASDLQRISIVVMGTILTQNPLGGLVYAPVIEPESDNAVVSSSSYEKLKRGDFNKIPVIIGYNSAEATSFSNMIRLFGRYLEAFDYKPAHLVPESMRASKDDLNAIGHLINEKYTSPVDKFIFSENNFVNFLSDNAFVRPILETANLMSKYGTVYLYRFSYTNDPTDKGAGHADELYYLFNSVFNSRNDWLVKTCITKLWSNFAKYGKRTLSENNACGRVVWKPLKNISTKEKYYLNIDKKTALWTYPDEHVINFWKNLYEKYGNPPYLTY